MSIYKRGNVLKSTIRTDKKPLFVMVVEDEAYKLTATEYQFSAVVLHDCGEFEKTAQVANNWNKRKWELTNMDQIENLCDCRHRKE